MAKKERMTSKERVLKAYHFERPDRIPIDFCACEEVYKRLQDHFGTDQVGMLEKLHVDFRWPRPAWIGPELKLPDGTPTDYFGIPRCGVGDFGYSIQHPLAHLESEKDIEAYPWPTADMWDYDVFKEECERFEGYALYGGGWAWFFEAAAELVGMEKFFMMLYDDPDLVQKLLGRIVDFFYEISKRMYEKAGDKIDIFFMGDDYGTQRGPLISLKMWRKFIKPHLKRLYDLAKEYDLLIMHHSCGSIVEFLPDMMEIGLNIIEPVQVRAFGMDVKELVKKFGGRLCFHGSIDTQHTLPFGKPEDVRREVLDRIETFREVGGFTISPTQHLLPEIPLENILTMYETAYECGWLD
ncbi:MAG: uroporphyrinogen decarboxylase family protein [Anaerolineae bacterium]